jgi:DNA polymerase III subunit delta
MIITLTGANTFAIQEKLAEIKQKFVDKNGSEGIESLNGESLDPVNLPQILTSISLFTPNRLIIIKNISENKAASEKLIGYIESIPDEVTVIIKENQLDKRTVLYKTLKKLTDFHEFAEPSEQEIIKWIQVRTQQEGGKIDQTVARKLYEMVGADQMRLSNEIPKLVAFQTQISLEVLNELVEANPSDTVFQLLENSLNGQTKQALEILDNLERSFEDPFQTANMLIWQTQVLAIVKSAGQRSDSEVAKEAKLNPYVVQKTRTLARRIDRPKLLNIIDAVAKLDIRLKSTSVEPWRAIEQTILLI